MITPSFQLPVINPRPPPSHSFPGSSGSTGNSSSSEGNRNSFRRRLYRRGAEVSANDSEHLKLPPIPQPVKPAKKVLDLAGEFEAMNSKGPCLQPHFHSCRI